MSDGEDAQPKTLAERIALLGLGNSAARPSSRASQRALRPSTDTGLPAAAPPSQAPKPPIPNKPAPIQPQGALGDGVLHPPRNGVPAVQAQRDADAGPGADEAPLSAVSVKDRIQSIYRAQHDQPPEAVPSSAVPNPFASPELPDVTEMEMCPVSPLPPLPSAVPVLARRATDVARHPMAPRLDNLESPFGSRDTQPFSADSTPRPSIGRAEGRAYISPPPPPPQTHRPVSVLSADAHMPPQIPPKPARLGAIKSPIPGAEHGAFGRSQSVSVPVEGGVPAIPRGVSLPPPPAPPQSQRAAVLPPPPPPPAPLPFLSQAVKRTAQARASLPPPPPPPAATAQAAGYATTPDQMASPGDHAHTPASSAAMSRQSSTARVGAAAAASNHARTALDFSSDAALRPAQPSYRGCNRRPPSLGVHPVLSLDAAGPAVSCLGGQYAVVVHHARVVCTRVDTGEIGAIHNAPGPEERFVGIAPVQAARDPAAECTRVWASTSLGRVLVLSTGSTGAYQERLQSASRAPIFHMFAAGPGEIWTVRDDGLVEVWHDRGTASDQPMAPQRQFSISSELQLARRAGRPVLLLARPQELWLAGGRSVWVFDPQRASAPLASVAGSALLSSQAPQPASAALGLAQLGLTAHDAAITCLAANTGLMDEAAAAARGLVFAGTDAGHVLAWRAGSRERWRTLDMSGGERDARVTALACVGERHVWVGLASGRLAVVDTSREPWAVAKEWAAAESAVAAIHVDWTPLLTARAKLQVASVHANGSVFFWDGALAHDRMAADLRRRTPALARTREITVQINSWNIGAVKPDALDRADRGFVARWLGACGAAPELLVVGLQEVVDLESKKMTAKSLWRNTTKQRADISKRYGLWRRALERALARGAAFAAGFRIVECQNMVGLFVCVFARDDVYRAVHEVDVAHVKTGLGGLHGNKGAIGVRVVFDDTSLCFVNAHLAAGESAGNNLARIQHCAAIVRGLAFKRPAAELQALQLAAPAADLANTTLDAFVDGGDGQRFLDHAACFFSGDLNFRLRTSRMQAERLVDAGELDTLLQFDQLLPMLAGDARPIAVPPPFAVSPSGLPSDVSRSRSPSSMSSSDASDDEEVRDVGSAGFALRAFHEMPIRFRPTYKYDVGTERYDTSEKRRTPAWCDRVLFRGQTPDHDAQGCIAPLDYQRLECMQSDHRPIVAALRVAVKHVDRDARARVLAEVCADYQARTAAEATVLARVLWLARHTRSFGAAAQRLADAGGSLDRALDTLLGAP
ncbi:hypothetical protein H4R23_000951 [Coemansia sp. Cherry 401B]|nr:hypothetical protein H4R23_000951 [Coemansia sp. Cherry 401B]